MKNKVLITGGLGQLGIAFQERFLKDRVDFCSADKQDFDISDIDQAQELIKQTRPDFIVNCAAYNLVDKAEDDPKEAFLVNREGVKNLALLCREKGIFLVHYGTDYIFDGKKGKPYTEEDASNPLNQYGISKLAGEKAVEEILSDYLIFRVSWVFGKGKQNFLYKLNEWVQKSNALQITDDEISVPTSVDDIVEGTMRAMKKSLVGLYHMPNSGLCSRYEWAKYFFERMQKKIDIKPVSLESFNLKAKRPKFSAMSNEKVCQLLNWNMPSWQKSVESFISLKQGKY
ncbi:MAG: dTDP-4-dehydrorhamnose reductase [Candidatus Omnitrophica bacterium]|nr:dTDP-4-dehydrorhamnose reductase [Candidatus Omnitrophota bacterium]